MSELPPIPDPHTPIAEKEPVWLVALVLAGLIYMVLVTVFYLLLRSSPLIEFQIGSLPAIWAQMFGAYIATVFVQLRYRRRILAIEHENITSSFLFPIKMSVALSFTLAAICFIQGLVFESLWQWMIVPGDPRFTPQHFYRMLIISTAFAFFYPFCVTQMAPKISRKRHQPPCNKTNP